MHTLSFVPLDQINANEAMAHCKELGVDFKRDSNYVTLFGPTHLVNQIKLGKMRNRLAA